MQCCVSPVMYSGAPSPRPRRLRMHTSMDEEASPAIGRFQQSSMRLYRRFL